MSQRHPAVRFHALGQNAQRSMLVEIKHVNTKSGMVHAFYVKPISSIRSRRALPMALDCVSIPALRSGLPPEQVVKGVCATGSTNFLRHYCQHTVRQWSPMTELRSRSFAWQRKYANVILEACRGLQTQREINCRGVIASQAHFRVPPDQTRRARPLAALALPFLTPAALLTCALRRRYGSLLCVCSVFF